MITADNYQLIFVSATHYDGEKTKRGDTVKIEPISNGNLRIWLAEDEIEEWGLGDSRGKGVRRLVRHALSAVGRSPAARVWAELLPVAGGGVLLISCPVHTHRPTVYAVEAEALPQVYARWRPAAEETAQVYAVDGEYHVVLYGERSDTLLREYGTPLGGGAEVAAHTAEYGEWVGEITAPAPPLPANGDRGR